MHEHPFEARQRQIRRTELHLHFWIVQGHGRAKTSARTDVIQPEMTSASHPYSSLPARAFWRSAVADLNPLEWTDVYAKRFDVEPDSAIATLGSCFAQHLRQQLRARDFNHQDFEPAPPALPEGQRPSFGYELFSARTGNIYTARQLYQLFQEAFGKRVPASPVWEDQGRFFDPLRPTIEPEGFGSLKELKRLRVQQHLPAVRELFLRSEVLVFTLGLTEAWISRSDGTVFPLCPGVAAGRFDPDEHQFHNFSYPEVLADMVKLLNKARQRNPALKVLLTVSPVPLTATASDQHVLSATTYSKSVLRSVCGELCRQFEFVDYFPSYELVTAAAARGIHFEANWRNVSRTGVALVMDHFFAQHTHAAARAGVNPVQTLSRAATARARSVERELAAICDEERLDPAAS